MKFIIWGAGYRGRKLLSCMNKEKVIAFVDQKLCGDKIEGVPCINFEEYEVKYKDVYIIISQADFKPLEEWLCKRGIKRFFVLEYSPSELPNYDGELPFDEMVSYHQIKNKNKVGILGVNLFSILLYDFLSSNNIEVFFLYNDLQKKLFDVLAIDGEYNILHENEMSGNECVMVADSWVDKRRECMYVNEIKFYEFPYLDRYIKYKRINKFKNIHKGERCFIVATGPSLKISDLDKLYKNKEYTISVNTVYKVFNRTKWRPNYLVVTDTATLDLYFDELVSTDIRCKFLADRQYKKWGNICKNDIVLFHLLIEYYESEGPKFSYRLDEGVYYGYTVLYAAIQIAVFMGFSEIYIIGADCEVFGDGKSISNHFISDYDDMCNDFKMLFDYERMFSAYRVAGKYAKEKNIKIYNATRGGKLEEFTRVDFDELFK